MTQPDQPSYRAVAGERPCGDPACVCAGSAAPAITVLPPSMATHTPATFNRAYELGRAAGVAEGRRQATEGAIVEHGIRMSGGGHHVRLDHPEIERIFPLADWIRASQRNGGKVDTRRVIVVEDWAEVPRAGQDGADRG